MLERKILFGDAFELIKEIPDKSVDFVLTDPPYLLDLDGGKNGGFKRLDLLKNKTMETFCNGFDYETMFNEYIRVCKKVNICVFCSNKQVADFMYFFQKKKYKTTLLVWDKPNPPPLTNNNLLSNLEFIVLARETGVFFNNKLDLEKKRKSFVYPILTKDRIHPTQKPIGLIRDLLSLFSKEGDLVLDTFSGSGTIYTTCKAMDRFCIAFENNKQYYDASIERLEELRKNPSFLSGNRVWKQETMKW